MLLLQKMELKLDMLETDFICHSMNPVGKKNIESILDAAKIMEDTWL